MEMKLATVSVLDAAMGQLEGAMGRKYFLVVLVPNHFLGMIIA